MRKILLIPLLIAFALFTGCASINNNPDQLASYIADARDIADLGTTAALIENPANRKPLEAARDALKGFESLPDGQITVDQLVSVFTKLPLDQLKSEKGQIYVTGGRILVRRFVSWASDPQLDVGASGALKKFAAAMREGMDAALQTAAPSPAK